jgi:hypothetical protein
LIWRQLHLITSIRANMMLSEMGWAMAVEGATSASVFEAYIEHFMVLVRVRRQDLHFPTLPKAPRGQGR